MLPETARTTESIVYFVVLIVMEILAFILILVSKQDSYVMMNVFRFILLICAYFCKSGQLAGYYSVFAFISAILLFDPVGLWMTGRKFYFNADGQARSKQVNAFCVVVFLLTGLAAYIGYLFKKSLDNESQEQFFQNEGNGYTNPNQQNYMYTAPSQPQSQRPDNKFNQFSGQAYALNW